MSDNLREFDIGVRRFTEKTVPEAVRDTRDAAALEGLKSLVMLTPVDTGRARGNWQVTVGSPAVGEIDREDKDGSATIAAGAAVVAGASDPYVPIWAHDGVSYITHINDGTEKVPAIHMLEQTVARLRRIFGGR